MSKTMLSEVGDALVKNGYHIVPIMRGEKRPFLDGWQNIRADKGELRRWLDDGKADCGVGIITAHTPAVDIDCLDDDVAAEMLAWIEEEYGVSEPLRYGKRPKALLLFRVDEPFRKLKSSVWEDPDFGKSHAVEILGEGQQFVAFGVHKDTKRPYEWVGTSPLDTPAADLPLLTHEMALAIIDKFDELAANAGWERKSGQTLQRATYSGEDDPDDDDAWDRDVLMPPLDVEIDDLRKVLLSIPNNDADYDIWLNIGMALYHQFGGADQGLELWDEWGEAADKFDPRESKKKWRSFDHKNKRQTPITARTIYKYARDAETELTAKLLLELSSEFMDCRSLVEWGKVAKKVKHADLDIMARRSLESIARDAYQTASKREQSKMGIDDKSIKPATISVPDVRKALAYQPDRESLPKWLSGWVFDDSQDAFVKAGFDHAVSITGFNANFNRYVKHLKENRGVDIGTASAAALDFYEIKVVNGVRYEPGAGNLFREDGKIYANSYREDLVPLASEELTPKDKIAVRRVTKHIKHLLPDEDEARMFTDWLAWVVQNPGRRVNYAVLLQGTQGDGKSFFRCLLETVMGMNNVRVMKAKSLEGDFNGWAVGQCVTAIEEVRLAGHNRFEILNNLKDQITNDHIEVHKKGVDQYTAKNTTNYLLFTNFNDALPIDDNDRRYLVLSSQWQSREALDEFEQANDDYYEKLYQALEIAPGGLRKWFLDYKVSEEFNPKGKAPITKARASMIRMSKPDWMACVEEVVKEGKTPGVSRDVIVASKLKEALQAFDGLDEVKTKSQATYMAKLGYLVRDRFTIDGCMTVVYAKAGGKCTKKDGTGAFTVDREVVQKMFNRFEGQDDFEDDTEL